MTVYASKNFITKLKCSVSVSKHKTSQAGPFDGWTADLLKVSKVDLVAVMMHDGSLATVIVPTLHDAKRLIEADVLEQVDRGRPIDWNKAADFINETPFSVIDDQTPAQALTDIISREEKLGRR